MKRSHRAFAALAIVSALAIAAPAPAVPVFAQLAQARTVDTVARLSDLARITVTGRRVPYPGGDQIEVRVPCPEGTQGKRVQAIYAFIAGQPNRYGAKVSGIRHSLEFIDQVFEGSAQETGGHRFVRWVRGRNDCVESVVQVSISQAAAKGTRDLAAFRLLISELKSKGYANSDRKYLVWIDIGDNADTTCKGRGQVANDDRPTLDNRNNGGGGGPSYAAVDLCNGFSAESLAFLGAHELMHTLGAVQLSAPNATAGGHCTDGHDMMCYEDAADVVLRIICPDTGHENLFDCRHDDYFHAGEPPAGSYLATHWNTANSSFLINSDWPR